MKKRDIDPRKETYCKCIHAKVCSEDPRKETLKNEKRHLKRDIDPRKETSCKCIHAKVCSEDPRKETLKNEKRH